jgi:peptidoglycan hydrolase-like protein with peptidoglycan-binding domain
MKQFVMIIIVAIGMTLAATPSTFAQTQAQLELAAQLSGQESESDLQSEYDMLLLELIDELQQQINTLLAQQSSENGTNANDAPIGVANTNIVLGPNQLCEFRYVGFSDPFIIQTELQNQGYTITKIDGKIGPETRAAVMAFQTDVGAAKIDGLIGDETRTLLSRESVVCIGDNGVTQSTDIVPVIENNFCSFGYTGSQDITAIQTELQNQGYTITKIDGKIGPETRAAVMAFQTAVGAAKIDGLIGDETRISLSRESVSCSAISSDTNTNTENQTNTNTETTPPTNTTETTTTTAPSTSTNVTSGFITQNQILADVRSSTAGIPDNTAVVTYQITFDNDTAIYVPSNPEQAFDIELVDGQGNPVAVSGVKSIVSSAAKILRDDRTSYFRIVNGDTMSLRSTLQPGAGMYYGQLGRLSYTNDNATTTVNPAMINYEFDTVAWRTAPMQLAN